MVSSMSFMFWTTSLLPNALDQLVSLALALFYGYSCHLGPRQQRLLACIERAPKECYLHDTAPHLGLKPTQVFIQNNNTNIGLRHSQIAGQFLSQLNRYGVRIPEDEQKIIWLIPYLNWVPVSVSEKTRLKQYMNAVPPTLDLPFQPFNWLDFASSKKIHAQDFFQFVMLLAGGMSAFHYQKVLSVDG